MCVCVQEIGLASKTRYHFGAGNMYMVYGKWLVICVGVYVLFLQTGRFCVSTILNVHPRDRLTLQC